MTEKRSTVLRMSAFAVLLLFAPALSAQTIAPREDGHPPSVTANMNGQIVIAPYVITGGTANANYLVEIVVDPDGNGALEPRTIPVQVDGSGALLSEITYQIGAADVCVNGVYYELSVLDGNFNLLYWGGIWWVDL